MARSPKRGKKRPALGVGQVSGVVVTDPSGDATTVPYNDLADLIGAGDVRGPGGSTDNAIARFDGATGKLLQDGNAILEDDGRITTVTDPTDPQDVATKAYVDAQVAGGSSASYIPLSLGVEPLQFVSDGAGSPILIPYTP